MIQSNFTLNIYLVNQIIDILLWSWILLIMIKRVVCRGFDLRVETVAESIRTHSLISITRKKLKDLLHNYHYISDILLLVASIIAVCKFSNQFYDHSIGSHYEVNIFQRTVVWMIFHKLLTISILFKYKKSQPKLFINIKDELKRLIIWKEQKQL